MRKLSKIQIQALHTLTFDEETYICRLSHTIALVTNDKNYGQRFDRRVMTWLISQGLVAKRPQDPEGRLAFYLTQSGRELYEAERKMQSGQAD